MAKPFRLDFFNAQRSIDPFVTSLLTVGQKRSLATLTGWLKAIGRPDDSVTVNLAVTMLGAEDDSGNRWFFNGYIDDGKFVDGLIDLTDGTGYIEYKG